MTPTQIVDLLNEVAAADPTCVAELIEKRVLCSNETLRKHPTVVVVGTKSKPKEPFSAPRDPRHYLGVLGILNGILGLDSATIEAVYEKHPDKRGKRFIGFRLREFKEPKRA